MFLWGYGNRCRPDVAGFPLARSIWGSVVLAGNMQTKVFRVQDSHLKRARPTSMLISWTGALRRGCDQQENGLKVEKPQFHSDRGYFRLRLVLEHHVLRRMDDGGRCVMSKMEPARGMARAGTGG